MQKEAQTKQDVFIAKLTEIFEDKILEIGQPLGDVTILIDKKHLLEVAETLRDSPDLKFEQMIDLTAVDYLNHEKKARFQMVYHFFSLSLQHRLRLKCFITEDDLKCASISKIWLAADWYERECYDMYGIIFSGHPNLKRILMYDEFKGHPLRKDYLITEEQPRIPLKEVPERHSYMDKLD